jgi:hypothetical protein
VNDNKFKLTQEAVGHLIEVLRLHLPFKQVMNELIKDGVEDVELQIFEARFNTLLNILLEYSEAKLETREFSRILRDWWEVEISHAVHLREIEHVKRKVLIYDDNEIVLDEEITREVKERETQELPTG